MKKVFCFISFMLICACASKPKAVMNAADQGTPPDFQRGLRALEEERYADASEIFDHLLVKRPATEYDLVVLYNSAAADEGLGDCGKAAKKYHQLAVTAPGKFPRVEAEALYRLGLMYECLGNDVKTIAALLDAKRHGRNLPAEVRTAQIPARLAAAYSRLGNHKRALYYFNEASHGLKGVVASSGLHVNKSLLGRTLYMMGKLNSAQRAGQVEPTKYLEALSMQQPFLLQAMDLGQKIWNGKAAEDLSLAYDNIWKFQIQDPAKRRDFYIRALQVLNELKRIKLPSQDPLEVGFFADLDKHESRLQSELAKVAVTTKLTPEAQKREGLKRKGRIAK